MNRPKTDKFEAAEKKCYLKGHVQKATNPLTEFYDDEDLATSVADCISDLMHLCHAKGYDFLEQYERGRGRHNAELNGGEHG